MKISDSWIVDKTSEAESRSVVEQCWGRNGDELQMGKRELTGWQKRSTPGPQWGVRQGKPYSTWIFEQAVKTDETR